MRPTAIVLLLTLLAGGAWSQALVPKSTALSYSAATGLDTSNGALRLTYEYVQPETGGPLYLEAERASVLAFTPGKGQMAADAQASGGLSVAHVDRLEFRFTVRQAGAYTAYYRGLFPWAGTWLHFENMDGGTSQTVTDSHGQTLGQWLWTKGPTYQLAAGAHVWQLAPSGWTGGAQLDKVVLVPEGGAVPTGAGEPALRSVGPATGQATTEEFMRRGLAKWSSLAVENPAGRGTVEVEWSADRGRTWQPLPAGGDLSGLSPETPLRFRLTLTADAEGASPYVGRTTVAYTLKQLPPLVLENDQVQLRFSAESGALVGLRNKVTRTECMDPDTETPLFSFVGYRPEFKTVVEIGFGQAELKQVTGPTGGRLTLGYELMGGGLQATVTVRLQGPLARFSQRVDNRTIYDLAQARFVLRGLRMGEDCTDDYLVTPVCTGAIVKNPAALEYPRLTYTDRPLGYPGMATMCWMDLYDAQGGGVYLACEDPLYRLTELTFSNGVEDRPHAPPPPGVVNPPTSDGLKYAAIPGTYVNIGFDKRLLINRRTGPVTLPEVVVGLHAGDWHWGADRYREWIEPQVAKVRDVPDWLRDTEGWVSTHMVPIGETYNNLAKGWAQNNRRVPLADPPFPLIALWCQNAAKQSYAGSDYLNRQIGTEEEYRAALQKQHEFGHRLISYILPTACNPAYTWNAPRIDDLPRSAYPDDEVIPPGFYAEVGLRGYDGNLRGPDGVSSQGVVCLGATKWQQYLTHIVLDKYQKDYAQDGMYLDGAGLFDLYTQDCKFLGHGHAGYGEWTEDFLKWLATVKRETRRTRPGAVFAGEGMNDVYHGYLDIGLTYPDNAPQVYSYTCPWSIGVILGYEMPGFPFKDWPKGYMELCCLYGYRFGDTGGTFDDDPVKAQRILDFRRPFSQFQFRSRFMDNQGLTVYDNSVLANLFTRDEAGTRGALVVAWNPQEKAGVTAAVAADRVGKLKTAWLFRVGAKPERLETAVREGQYRFALAPEKLCAVLLLERCEPLIDLDKVSPVVAGEPGQVTATLRNLEADAQQGTVSLRLPGGWPATTAPFRVSAGGSTQVTLSFTPPAGTRYDVYDLSVVIREGNRLTDKCIPFGVCRAVQAELYHVRRDQLRLEMANSSARPVSGTCRFVAPAGLSATPAETPFSLPPHGKAELLFTLAGTENLTTREHVKAVLTYGKDQTTAYEVMQPPLLNGDFELDRAGDGHPDWWNYATPVERYYTIGVCDAQDPAEGKYCLRLNPAPQSPQALLATTYVKLIPNTRYRLSGKIKRSAHSPGIVLAFYSWGAVDPKRKVGVYLGQKQEGPVGVWEDFSQEFLSADADITYELLLCNNRSEATVWFDDLRIEEVQ